MLFREAVIAFLGADGQTSPQDTYCEACRQLGENDCDRCDRQIEVMDV